MNIVEADNGEDPSIELAPVRRGRPPLERAPQSDVAKTIGDAIAAALAGNAGQSVVKVRYQENKDEVILIANRRLHVDAAHLAARKTDGTAHGVDGMSEKFKEGDLMVLCAGPHVDYLKDNGFAREYKKGVL